MGKRKTVYTMRPSQRNGHPLTEEDRFEITKNIARALKAIKGYEKIKLYDEDGNVICEI